MLTILAVVLGFLLGGPVGAVAALAFSVFMFGAAEHADQADAAKQKETGRADAQSVQGACFPVFMVICLVIAGFLVIMAPLFLAPPDCQTIYLNHAVRGVCP